MGFFSSKIFRIIFVFTLFSLLMCCYADDVDVSASMMNFVKPQYNENTHLLEYVLTGADATTDEGLIKITDAKIELIGQDGKTIKAVITTPVAYYNQATQFINGDKSVHFRSLAFDADGVGFDASQISQTLHIRKDVKLVIKSIADIKSDFAMKKGLDQLDSGRTVDSVIEEEPIQVDTQKLLDVDTRRLSDTTGAPT